MRVGNLPGIRRLPIYLHILRQFLADGVATTSAPALGQAAGLVASVVRKDLEMTGVEGTTGIGYAVADLVDGIETFLGWNNPNEAFLVGAGKLGTTILGYDTLRRQGLNIIAAFDVNPDTIGSVIHGVEVLPLGKLATLPGRLNVTLGVLTVPDKHAQRVADLMVKAGITRIWSFATPILSVPTHVVVQREDFSVGLTELLMKSAAMPKK